MWLHIHVLTLTVVQTVVEVRDMMGNYIQLFYVDVVIYSCPNVVAGLANHYQERDPWCTYHNISNIRRTLAANKIVDHSDVVGAALTTSSFLT